MPKIQFSTDEKAIIVDKLKGYFDAELDYEIGQFDAEFLIDYFSENLGDYYYNRGLQDTQIVARSKLDDLEAEIESLTKPTDFIK